MSGRYFGSSPSRTILSIESRDLPEGVIEKDFVFHPLPGANVTFHPNISVTSGENVTTYYFLGKTTKFDYTIYAYSNGMKTIYVCQGTQSFSLCSKF